MKQHAAHRSHRFFTVAFSFLACSLPISAANADEVKDASTEARANLDDWNANGAAACEAQDPACPKLAEALYRAAVGFQAAGERDKAMSARQILLNPRYHLEKLPIARKAMFQLADDYKALTEFARAAEQYEAAVQQSPDAAEAPEALIDATVLHLASGNMSRATKNAENYDKLYGAKLPSMAATIWLAIALTHIEREQMTEAKNVLEKIIGRIDRVGELRDRFVAHSGRGRVLKAMGDMAGAEREYEIVKALWEAPENQKRVLSEADTNPRNVGKVLSAVGEALFFFAEKKRQELEAIRYPVYTGRSEKSAVVKHINTQVAAWVAKKRSAIEATEKNYRNILDLQPAPPPQWVIASTNRIGTMWAKFAAEFRAAPIPKAWRKNGFIPGANDLTYEEIRTAYYEAIDQVSEPNKVRAKISFRTCVDFSVKFQYVDEFSRGCGAWLEKHYRKEYVPVTEMIPSIRTHAWNLGWAMILPDPRTKP